MVNGKIKLGGKVVGGYSGTTPCIKPKSRREVCWVSPVVEQELYSISTSKLRWAIVILLVAVKKEDPVFFLWHGLLASFFGVASQPQCGQIA